MSNAPYMRLNLSAGGPIPPGVRRIIVDRAPIPRTPKSVDDMKKAINEKYEYEIAVFNAKIEDLGETLRGYAEKQKETKKQLDKILEKKEPHLIRSNDLQKEIHRLQREIEKEEKAARAIDTEANAKKHFWKEADDAAAKAKVIFEEYHVHVKQLRDDWAYALKNLKELMMKSAIMTWKKQWAEALDGIKKRVEYRFDSATKSTIIIYPFPGSVWAEFRKGSPGKAATLAGEMVYRTIVGLNLEWENTAMMAAENYTQIIIQNRPDPARDTPEGKRNFILAEDPEGKINPLIFERIQDDVWAEVRNDFI